MSRLTKARAGIPSAKTGQKVRTVARISANRCFTPSLGDTPILTRSLRCIGGARPGCRWTKKRENKARRAGYPSWDDMQAKMTMRAKR